VHEQAGRLFGYPKAHPHIACRKAFGAGGHLKTDEESFAHPELHFMEQRICCG